MAETLLCMALIFAIVATLFFKRRLRLYTGEVVGVFVVLLVVAAGVALIVTYLLS